ncbi:hypothetical protein K5Y32_07385 [Pantoea sp. DY-15]|uniref:hypothetical protein n=1 Tax=Pantoea sp. DY-15 TaxID=2871489 RepID=UPI001C972AE7|nr:hypothetical protein [Pantoea sp. DY-15]MBY4887755.1 hypothetical protein [Pantoea sp. DY-15]
MAIWIEFRCELRSEGIEDQSKRCLSDDNIGPMEMAGDTQKSVNETISMLGEIAKKEGWVRTRDGWVCPNCMKRGANHD